MNPFRYKFGWRYWQDRKREELAKSFQKFFQFYAE